MTLRSLDHGGDGDDIAALESVERAFGIAFTQDDADRFVTAGDVFDCVLEKLGLSPAEGERLWERFAREIAAENDLPAEEVGRETLLLSEPLQDVLKRGIARLLRR